MHRKELSKKLIVLDIDGTLIDRNQKMSEKVRYAIAKARQEGNVVCICSGRCHSQVPEEMKEGIFDGIISAAGAAVTWKEKLIAAEYLTEEQIGFLMDELEKANSICVYEAYDGIYMKKSHKDTLLACLEGAPEKAIFRNVKELSEKKINEKELSRKESGENESGEKESGEKESGNMVYPENIHKVSFYMSDQKKEYWKALLQEKGFEVSAFSQPGPLGNCGEICKSSYDKGYALKLLADYLNWDIKDTIAIGDSENDISMLKAAGIGIAMGNALDEVKVHADEVTEPVDKDGVYTAFVRHGIIPAVD